MPTFSRSLSIIIPLFFLASSAVAFAQGATPTQVQTGIFRGRRITYQMRQGKMIFEGDITLEHVDQKISEGVHASGTLATCNIAGQR
jgi:lipopolysaccharide export system protein LptA